VSGRGVTTSSYQPLSIRTPAFLLCPPLFRALWMLGGPCRSDFVISTPCLRVTE
jgi:hypothetical protein